MIPGPESAGPSPQADLTADPNGCGGPVVRLMPPEAEEALAVRPGTGIDVTAAADAADDVWNALERPAGNSDDEPFSSEDVYKTTERY